MLIQSVAVRHLEIFERRKAFAQAHFQCRDAFYVISLSQSAVSAPCPSMREILVKASGMARGRVRLRRTSPQMTFLHAVIFAQRDLACLLFEKSSQPAIR